MVLLDTAFLKDRPPELKAIPLVGLTDKLPLWPMGVYVKQELIIYPLLLKQQLIDYLQL